MIKNASPMHYLKKYAATIGCAVAMLWPAHLLLLQALNKHPSPEEVKWVQAKVLEFNQATPNFILERENGDIFYANFISDLSTTGERHYFIEEGEIKRIFNCNASVGLRSLNTPFGVKNQILGFKCKDVEVSFDQILDVYQKRESGNLRSIKLLAMLGVLFFCFLVDQRRNNV